jgi:hypothetical protein
MKLRLVGELAIELRRAMAFPVDMPSQRNEA